MTQAPANAEQLAHFGMLASALAGRELSVEFAEPAARAWTNGSIIHIEGAAAFRSQLQELCVQSALLAAGSLHADIVRRFARQPDVANRYLAVEGHRALSALEAVLPPQMKELIDPATASRSTSAETSLAIALGKAPLNDAPQVFGQIRARELLATIRHDQSTDTARAQHIPRKAQDKPLEKLNSEADAGDDIEDIASSPVGGGGGLGKLLQKLFDSVRQLKGGGSPGADAPTHWSRSGPRTGARAVQSNARADTIEGAFGKGTGVKYPEWDVHRRHYRPDWCTVQELDPPADTHASVTWLEGHGLRKPLSRLGLGLDRFRRQAQGDDIDIDAAIEAQVEAAAGTPPDEYIYIESQRHRRDLSVLILLDISGSVTQASPAGATVHEQQRSAAAALMTVLFEIGDRVSLYAFSSQGRSAVQLVPVKRFDETLDSRIMRRLYSLIPGAYSRLGAAIRHGATLLIDHGGTARRLLLVLSDGLAYDHGYEPAYGRADARQALAEARRDGVGCLCLSIGASTDTAQLKQIFGSAAHANVPKVEQLRAIIGPLIRSALRSGEARRRIA